MGIGPNPARPAQVLELYPAQCIACRLQKGPPTGQNGQVFQRRSLFVNTITGRFHGDGLELLGLLIVRQQQGDGATGKLAGNDQQRANVRLHRHGDHGQKLMWIFNLKIADQDGGVLHLRSEPGVVGNHLTRNDATLPIHPLDVLALQLSAAARPNFKPAVFADDVEDLAQHLGQGRVITDGFSNLGQLLFTFQVDGHAG